MLVWWCRRGRWLQAEDEGAAFEVAQLPDWEALMDFYGDDEMLSCDHPATRSSFKHTLLLGSACPAPDVSGRFQAVL